MGTYEPDAAAGCRPGQLLPGRGRAPAAGGGGAVSRRVSDICARAALVTAANNLFSMSRPSFELPVFERLYERDYFIDEAVLREILALGPETAVPELLKIAHHTLDVFAVDEEAVGDWPTNFYFYHALYLLHALQAPEAFDVYLRVLRLDSDSTEFWFGDDLFEDVPNLLAAAARTRLPELLALLNDGQMLLKHRLVASHALELLAKNDPAQRPAISAFLQTYLRHVIAHAAEITRLLPDDRAGAYGYDAAVYLGFLLVDAQQAGLRELEPEIRELHRLGLVDETIGGGPEDIEFDPDKAYQRRPTPDIFARYEQMRDEPDNYSPFHPDAAGIAQRRAEALEKSAQLRREALARFAPQPRQVAPKIGRNDPCPCGSGQKYKKCHGG